MSASLTPTTDFDPTTAEFLADPYPILNAIRESDSPVAYAPATGSWVLTRHADVHACQRDARLGRVYSHLYTDEEFGQRPRDARWPNFWTAQRYGLLELEPPDHTRIRSLLAPAFTPPRFAALREPARRRAAELLCELRLRPSFDVLTDYAMPYAVGIVAELLGAPTEHQRAYLDWAHAMVRMFEVGVSDDDASAADRAAGEFIGCARELIAHKRRSPAGDVISTLVHTEIDGSAGGTLTDDEIVSTIILLLNAGHEATVNTTGNGVVNLLTHPDQWRLLVSGQAQPRRAVEELIRWDPPVQLFNRWALAEDVVIGEVTIPFGARIAMLYGAANRDPRVFEDPDAFDITRVNASRHVNFGGGIHACLGAPLARVELEATFSVLPELCPDLQLVERPRHTDAFVIWGYRQVPVTDPAA